MRIAVGSDHAGFHLKEHVKLELAAAGHDVVDVGTGSSRAVDYPRYAADAARLVGARRFGPARPRIPRRLLRGPVRPRACGGPMSP